MSKLLLVLFILVGMFSTSSRAALLDDLQDGQHVLLMRHADAPGFGDPPGYSLDNCSTQRNLGEKGRMQSVAIGKWLTEQRVTAANVKSSPWCRCLDTAKLIGKGKVEAESSLGSFFDDMSLAKPQTLAMQKLIATQLRQHPSTPLILVTHHVNIEAYTNKVVGVGDMVLVKVKPDGSYISHVVYPSP
ncbi:MAG: histidine phosphatase family protein [Sheuella sp.]|jgi:phosphohistidine phosphatase SixA|nr:histidine phosphatase family protein [Sheuella sp.]